MPDYEYLQVNIGVEIEGEALAASGRQVQNEGWKALEKNTPDRDDGKEDDEDNAPLPSVSEGENGECCDVRLQEKKTKAPARFTEASLLKAMNEIHRFVSNSENKKVLKETDGIGTAATRAGILKELIDFGQLEKKGKQLISTPAARSLIRALPEEITLPDLTAIWEMMFRRIKEGELSIDEVMEQIKETIRKTIAEAKPISVEGIHGAKPKQPSKGKGKSAKGGVKCPLCGAPMVLRSGKNGPFWGCSKYPECKATADDKDGKPKAFLKRVAGLPGDTVEAGKYGLILVAGEVVPNSAPLSADRAGRPLKAFQLPITLAHDEVWLLSDSPRGFDSRYLGPAQIKECHRVIPLFIE